jgi:polysaccharide biosynthesis/export protein
LLKGHHSPGKAFARAFFGIRMKQVTERGIGIGILLILLSGCLRSQTQVSASGSQAPPPPAAAAEVPHDTSFIIGDDDVLAINVWNEKDLTKSIPVRSDGKISLPLVGELQAAGRTPLQLEGDIADKLKSFITAPQVTVMVEEIKSQNVNVLGMVIKPGSYPLAQASTVVDAIAAAGGFKDFAKQRSIYVLRQGPNRAETRIPFNYKDFIKGKSATQNVKLEAHDTIVVP